MAKKDQKHRITIRNWDEYQREMRGGAKRRRRREWVALSVDLFSDPDFLALDQCHRIAWVGLLCHAGKVGPVFELCGSDARLLFRLRTSPDFQVLADQGFIDLEAATGQTIHDRQDKQDNGVSDEKPEAEPLELEPPESKPPPDRDEERLAELKAVYPKRAGSQPWKRAMKAANARMKDGATWTQILDGVRRYAEYCRATDKIGSEYVMMASTFCGPDEHFKQPWDPPASIADRRTRRNLDAVSEVLAEGEDEQ